ncbi:unnamed protein product, partial [Mesorhabditis belari]|uniref:CXXC-type zinc finger protein 1 n=1 Tax=Mesorhabditis belari TaxID=2138241 RepID=A0AAF3FN16_9BILA
MENVPTLEIPSQPEGQLITMILGEVKNEPIETMDTQEIVMNPTTSNEAEAEAENVKPEPILYCICKSANADKFMIACEKCDKWFHANCVNITKREANTIEGYFCPPCIEANNELKIIYKPKEQVIDKKPDENEIRCGGGCIGSNAKGCPHFKCIQAPILKQELEEKQQKAKVGTEKKRRGRKRKQLISDDSDDEDYYVEVKPKIDFKEVRNKAIEEAHREHETRKQKTVKRAAKQRENHHRFNVLVGVIYLGPECILAAQKDSKYCSEACGLRRAEARLDLLPDRAKKFWEAPPLNYLRAVEQGKKVEIQIEECIKESEKLVERMGRVQKWVEVVKNIEPVEDEEEDEGDESEAVVTYNCPVCALEYTVKRFRNMSSVASSDWKNRVKSETMFRWATGTHSICFAIVMCAEHYKGELENEMKICGYPLAWGDLTSSSTTFSEAFSILMTLSAQWQTVFVNEREENVAHITDGCRTRSESRNQDGGSILKCVVGGSDLNKITEQLADSDHDKLVSSFDYVFAENGVVGFHGKDQYSTKLIQDQMGEEKLQDLINFVLEYFSKLRLPHKRGNFRGVSEGHEKNSGGDAGKIDKHYANSTKSRYDQFLTNREEAVRTRKENILLPTIKSIKSAKHS